MPTWQLNKLHANISRIARNVVDKADQSLQNNRFISILYTEIIILQLIWVCSLAQMKPVKYGETTYPQWSIALGWMVALLSIIPLPIFMIRQLKKAKGDNLHQVCTLRMAEPTLWGLYTTSSGL